MIYQYTGTRLRNCPDPKVREDGQGRQNSFVHREFTR